MFFGGYYFTIGSILYHKVAVGNILDEYFKCCDLFALMVYMLFSCRYIYYKLKLLTILYWCVKYM